MVLVGEREKERAAVRDVTAGVSAPRTATHTSFTCRGGRKDGVDSPAPLAHPVPCYWNQTDCEKQQESFKEQREKPADNDVMIHVFFFFFCLAVLSLPLTPSQLENEDVKVKKKNKTTSSCYFVFSSTNCFMHWRCKKMFFKIPRRSVLLTPFLLGRLWMLNTSRLTHSSASSNWGTISLWPCPNQ